MTLNALSTKGHIEDEFGEVVGKFWYRPSMMSFTLQWHKVFRDGYTLEGIKQWADRLDYCVVSD